MRISMGERKCIFKADGYSMEVFDMSNFDDFCQLNQDPIVSRYVNHNGGKPKTFRECVEKYDDITYGQEHYGYSYWAIYNDLNEFVGQCGVLKCWNDSNNFCYAFKKKYWGKGIGGKVCKLVIDYVFDNFDKIQKIETSVMSANVASVKIVNKIGFKYLYTKKEFGEDLEFFELDRDDFYENKKII